MPALVVNQGAIGDLLISLPAFRLLRSTVGDFTLAGDPERCLFLKACGEVSSVFPANSAAFAQLYSGSIPPHLEYFDEIWWFTRRRGLIPTILMMPDSPVRTKVVFTVDEGPDETNCSVFQFSQTVSALGDSSVQVEDFVQPLVHAKGADERTGFHLVVHPGSGSSRKNFPLDVFFRVAERILNRSSQMTCCFVIGPAEQALLSDVEGFATAWDGRVKIASGFDLASLAQLLGKARVYWGNDSGVSHLAAWCGAQTFINFGPTNPRLWTPICGTATVFESMADCSPCGDRYRDCSELSCLGALDEDMVFDSISAALERNP